MVLDLFIVRGTVSLKRITHLEDDIRLVYSVNYDEAQDKSESYWRYYGEYPGEYQVEVKSCERAII